MKRLILRCRLIIYFAILTLVALASCRNMFATETTPTIVPTSAPEKLKLINGEIDACLLVSPAEVETVLNIKVTGELRFAMVGAIVCKYTSKSDNQVIFEIVVMTDATLKKVNDTSSAVETYEMLKTADLNMSTIFKIEDIKNVGDQAYSKEGTFLIINVLSNNIYYQFDTRADGGIGYNALMELVLIAEQRMP